MRNYRLNFKDLSQDNKQEDPFSSAFTPKSGAKYKDYGDKDSDEDTFVSASLNSVNSSMKEFMKDTKVISIYLSLASINK